MEMPEKLRQIAKWIEDGREIEFEYGDSWHLASAAECISVCNNTRYRAKPIKPRTGNVFTDIRGYQQAVFSIELTPEVKEALKAAGIDYV